MHRVPDGVKQARGTFRTDRMDLSPTPESGRPKARAGMSAEQKKEWRRLVELLEAQGSLTTVDGIALEQAARALAEVVVLEAYLEANGAVYTTVNPVTGTELRRKRPEADLLNVAWRRAQSALRDLGLTPAARSRVKVPARKQSEKSAFASLLDRREKAG